MKLSSIALTLLLTANRGVAGFRASSDRSNDVMKKAVDDLILADVKPLRQEDVAPPLKNQILGTESPCLHDYWSRPDIHTFGNMGFGGALHAAVAPIATKIIDVKAYGGVDVRKEISQELRTLVNKTGARVVDLCCGVGMSTRALESAFHDAEFVVGVDTSSEMINMATAISGYRRSVRLALSRHNAAIKVALNQSFNKLIEAMSAIDVDPYPTSRAEANASYRLGNAENTELPDISFDLVTIMYGFHEVPLEGRARIINEARRLLRQGGHLAIIDISPTYEPSPHMLAGEPFVLEYQQNIDSQLADFPGFSLSKCKTVVPGHVNLWLMQADDTEASQCQANPPN